MGKEWNRRLAVHVLVGASLAPASTLVAAAASKPVHAERGGAGGILPAALTFFRTLVDRALTSSPAPVPGGPKTSSNPAGDNGAGIDPKGR
jgi:hypothetical protein